jgi:hypothetical protein
MCGDRELIQALQSLRRSGIRPAPAKTASKGEPEQAQ